jgi:hypothetical protein
LARKKRRVKLPRVALEQMMAAAQEASEQGKGMTAQEIFKEYYLRLMDKYRDYFFSDPWPKKWNINHVTTFSREDLDFIDENDDDFEDRVMTVILKKNVSLEGYNSLGADWTYRAYREQFVKPELKKVYEAFKELVKTGLSAEEILKKMLESEDLGVVHMSLVELLKDDCYLWDNKPLDLKVSEVLELIHTKEGYPEDKDNPEEDLCKRQREKLKKKP